jgi:hypothetical protein
MVRTPEGRVVELTGFHRLDIAMRYLWAFVESSRLPPEAFWIEKQ